MSSLYERIFPRFRPRRELRPQGSGAGWGARISWLGTAGFVVESREATVLIDPFVTRPGIRRIAKPFVPDDLAIARHVLAQGPGAAPPRRKIDAVLCGHSHYDHIADAPRIAKLSGAKLVGSASTCAWGRAEGLGEEQLVRIPPAGAVVRFGDIEIRFVASRHGRIAFGRVPFPGEVRGTPSPPKRVWHYRMGGAYGLLVRAPGVSIYHNGSADLIDAELEGERADVLLACLAGRKGTENYVGRLVSALSPRLVVPTHHDAFFAPLERGLHLLPGIDLEGFVSEVFTRAPDAAVITPDYEEPICVPAEDARGSVLAAG
ncbi:MAG: MBL fold metallo-hydrolase [Labilithrix sp.]|nr:MBL fold metallo-hydrolase [Labilithrix sp.]MCW5832243.1 MBL fold metallo-hydrolase [Labilithrix sp.]